MGVTTMIGVICKAMRYGKMLARTNDDRLSKSASAILTTTASGKPRSVTSAVL